MPSRSLLTEACCHERRGSPLRPRVLKHHCRASTLKIRLLQRSHARGVPQLLPAEVLDERVGPEPRPLRAEAAEQSQKTALLHDSYQRFADVAVLARGVRHDERSRICRRRRRYGYGQSSSDGRTPLELVPLHGYAVAPAALDAEPGFGLVVRGHFCGP